VLAFSLLLASCGNDSTGGGGGDGLQVKDATKIDINYFTGSPADLPNYTGTLDFTIDAVGTSLTNCISSSSIKVTNGKLNMTLGTPTDAAFSYTQSYLSANGVTLSPSDAKVFFKEELDAILFVTADLKYTLYCFQSIKPIVATILAYADKDVALTRSGVSITLKKGWNYLIQEANGNITTSQTLPSGCYWVVMNTRDW
jgi:hypothetical protein